MSERIWPKLPAYAGKHGHLNVWCHYCQKWHYHGIGEGHRGAHCIVADSPYRETGYILVYAGEWTDELKRQYRERRPAKCRRCLAYLSPVGERRCPKCGWDRSWRRSRVYGWYQPKARS